jgi:hypothetical protein
MAAHLVRIGALTLLILACLFLPYLPGGYDSFAVTLSTMTQMFGYAGLLLVPVAAIWLVYEARTRKGKGFFFAIAAIAVATLVVAIVVVGAFMTQGISLVLVAFAFWIYFVTRMVPTLKQLRTGLGRFNPAPLYLVVVPGVVSIVQFSLLGAATDFSRNRAIEASAPLIADIEKYRDANGRYPASLLALHQDYKTEMIGVERFFYEPNGEGYNLFFEQTSNQLGARELVVYNPRDEHLVVVHDSDILLWTPEQLRSRRTYNFVHDSGVPHWKYFWFD